ncbi:hypothetical protein Moror_15442 [Moniliophthora roreri MCA 2997]|uniref:Uncharacterized protein n=1 Tax=Moniliophthora roreri (strain MCA 2997) TaxID=1381753 RepID=V2WKP0_MONRO|nr:hypothetical protein Moror_15442 [Moniliophthora roreri MCA 2997]
MLNQNSNFPLIFLLKTPLSMLTQLLLVFECLKAQFHPEAEDIPTVGGEDFKDEEGDEENRVPSNDRDLLNLRLWPPMPAPTPMTQLIDHISVLCTDWSAISPEIACSTCVADASKLSLGILLETALSNEGLAALHANRLLRVHALCQSIVTTMMNLMTTTIESAEEEAQDAELLFIGSDPKKVRLFTVEERQWIRWQLNQLFEVRKEELMEIADIPENDDMLDTLYDYDAELYGDGES